MQPFELGKSYGGAAEIKPLRQSKYWASGGWSKVDLRQAIDPDAIDFVSVIESFQPWKQLKIPIDCQICTKEKVGQPYLDQVHWSYQQCLQCEDAFICAEHFSSKEVMKQWKEDHEGHKLIQFTTRPLAAPLYDGGDLDQLQAFRDSKTHKQFFTYFPWFFHCFAGMDESRTSSRNQMIAALVQSPTRGSESWNICMKTQDFPVDWYIRTFGGGPWESYLHSMQPLLDARIESAKASVQLNVLLLQLEHFKETKQSMYGPGDIPAAKASQQWRALVANLAPGIAEYTLYTMPLQFTTMLDSEINQSILRRLLVDSNPTVAAPRSGDLRRTAVSNIFPPVPFFSAFDAMRLEDSNGSAFRTSEHQAKNETLAPDIPLLGPDNKGDAYREIDRLWPMFISIFRNHELYLDLVSPAMGSDLSSYFGKMKPSWHSFLTKDHIIREKLWQMDYSNLPTMTPENLELLGHATAYAWPFDHPHKQALEEADTLRARGSFNQAAGTLNPLQMANPKDTHIALGLQQTYLEQGYYAKAMGCYLESASIEYTNNNSRGTVPIASALLLLISNYAACFVKGTWDVALADAARIFDEYLIKWNPKQEDVSVLVYLEIYYHRIVLITSQDLKKEVHKERALSRLRSIRERLCDMPYESGLAHLAWDVLLTELDLMKRSVRAQYFDVEDAFSVQSYLHTSSTALPMIAAFRVSTLILHAEDVVAAALLLSAEILNEDGEVETARHLVDLAESYYSNMDDQIEGEPHAGTLDCLAFNIRKAGRSAPFSAVDGFYNHLLRERNDLTRMREFRKLSVPYDQKDSPAYNWSFFQRADFRDLAEEAGDHLMYERWKLRKYAGDTLSVSSILDAERVIANHESVGIHSSLLVTLASFNLSRAYLIVGNFFDASLNSLLHLNMTAQREDVEGHQRAMLNVLHIFSEAVATLKDGADDILQLLATRWDGWLTPKSYDRWMDGDARCDEIDRFIDAALFFPNLAWKVGRDKEGASEVTPKPYAPGLVDRMITHLRLAFALYEALPVYLAHMTFPKLAFAVGSVATYVCNKELAIRTYAVGQAMTHSQDGMSLALFRLRAGQLMTLLGEEDPEHWIHVVPAGRALLSDSAGRFLSLRQLAGAQLKVCEANVALLRSVVAEARARKLLINNSKKEHREKGLDWSMELWTDIITLINLQEVAVLPMNMTDSLIDKTAERLVMASPYEANQNLAFLASSPIPRQNRELVIEFCYILADIETLQKRPKGNSLWTFIQRYKANVLYRQTFSTFVPARYLEAIEANSTALKLYREEQKLIKEGPQGMADKRLDDLSAEMLENPALKLLMDHRNRTQNVGPKDFHCLASLSRLTHGRTSNLILIDWMKYHDFFLITGYNVNKQKICILEQIPDCTVATVEKWIGDHLKVTGKQLPATLNSSDVFKVLWPLVRAIHDACTKEDLLIFSPSQELHSIPLHALPYANVDDRPIIDFHPVVYTPSNVILKECILKVIEGGRASPMTASLFGRWGAESSDAAKEENNISESLRSIASQLEAVHIPSKIVSGTTLTHSAFSSNMSSASILHFHTHVNETGLKQHLSLEPEMKASRNDGKRRVRGGINPFFNLAPEVQNNTYSLQDAFATQIEARLVVMMGCRSGQQHVSQSDDALGLISAFFAAGATSIIGTLWQFETSDATKFSTFFFKETFAEQKQKALIDVAGAFRCSIMEMRACQKPICRKRRTLEGRLSCHVNELQGRPYNWASFVLWGSWVMAGVGDQGGVSSAIRNDMLGEVTKTVVAPSIEEDADEEAGPIGHGDEEFRSIHAEDEELVENCRPQ